jgi:phage portal protein BeeE
MALQLLNLPDPPQTGKRADSALMGQPYNLGSLTSLFGGVRTLSGQLVTPQTAMRCSAVLACMRILAEDLSALPLNLYRRTPQGSVLATDDPRFRLLHDSPNPWQTSLELREGMVLDMLSYGQAFMEKEISQDGISALYPLSASRMVFVNPLDEFVPPPVPLFFRYADPRVGQRILMSDDLWIARMLAPGFHD